MRGSLSPSVATRLIKISGLFGSNHVGKRAATACQTARLLGECDLTWENLVLSPKPKIAARQPSYTGWRGTAADCQAQGDLLNNWERQSLISLPSRYSITLKQANILARLVACVRAASGAATS